MNVVQFPRASEPSFVGWQAAEITKLTNACAAVPGNDLGGWEVGMTERGDPQLYLLGPGPDHDCVLSISRLGRLYILEDGKGGVLFEHDNIALLAEQACGALRRRKAEVVAQFAVCWCAVREFFEEKVEPMLAEPMEVLSHFAPQLAALV